MSNPYRAMPGAEVLEVATRGGRARLDVAPTEAILELEGRARLAIASPWIEWRVGRQRHARVLSSRLDRVRVLVARTYPTGDVAVWIDGDRMTRALGLEPLVPIDDAGLAAARALDRLGDRLAEALEAQGVVAGRAIELGRGENRALVEIDHEHLELWLRPLFHDRLHRRLIVHADGRVRLISRAGERVVQIRRTEDILVRGDFLSFEPENAARADVWLPWIGPPERHELAAMCTRLLASLH